MEWLTERQGLPTTLNSVQNRRNLLKYSRYFDEQAPVGEEVGANWNFEQHYCTAKTYLLVDDYMESKPVAEDFEGFLEIRGTTILYF